MPKAEGGKVQKRAISGPAQRAGSSLPLHVGVDVVVVPVVVVAVAVVTVAVVTVDVDEVVVDVVVVAVFVVVVSVVAVSVVVVMVVSVALVFVVAVVDVVVVDVVVGTQLPHMTGQPRSTATMLHNCAPSSTQLNGSRSLLQNGEAVVVVAVAVVVVRHEPHSTGQSARNAAPPIGFEQTDGFLPLHKSTGSALPSHVAVVVVVVGEQVSHMIGQLSRTPAPTSGSAHDRMPTNLHAEASGNPLHSSGPASVGLAGVVVSGALQVSHIAGHSTVTSNNPNSSGFGQNTTRFALQASGS